MTLIQVTYSFVINTRILSSQVNQNFNDVTSIIASHHHDPNIYSNAVPITNSGIADNANIRDTQLKSPITRSGLISESSLGQISSPGIIAETAVPFLNIVFGDGSDGDVTISSPTTLTRDMYYNNLTVNDVITTGGFRIFVKGTISGSGTIKFNGSNGSAGSLGNGGTGGSGASAVTSGFFKNKAGGNGGNGGANNNGQGGAGGGSARTDGGTGGAGANGSASSPYSGGTGGGGGTKTSLVTRFGIYSHLTLLGVDQLLDGTFAQIEGGTGGGGGGGGGANGSTTNASGGGGGGGSSGGVVWIAARTWSGTFAIQATGGNGGNGTSGAVYGNGSAGGGGGGGMTIVIYRTKTWTGSYNVAGGTGGNNGASGVSYEVDITQLVR